MENKNMPAMPAKGEVNENETEVNSFQYDHFSKFQFTGLTKREMFAMNAPDVPDFFRSNFRLSNC